MKAHFVQHSLYIVMEMETVNRHALLSAERTQVLYRGLAVDASCHWISAILLDLTVFSLKQMVDISGIEKEPKNERIRLNVGGTVYETSLHTVIEGARAGGGVFKCLCAHILGEDCAHAGQLDSAWEARVFALEEEDMKPRHLVSVG